MFIPDETAPAVESTETAADADVTLSNEDIAQGLERIAELLGDDSRSERRRQVLTHVAGLVRATTKPVVELVEERGVEGVHLLGINYELSGIVTDWVRSGRLPWLERLEQERHEELVRLPGIGPRLAQELRDVLGVVDLDGLAEVAREGRLANLCGFGPKRMKLVTGVLTGRAAQSRRAKESRQLSLLASH